MKRLFLFSYLLLLCHILAVAQVGSTISGRILDSITKEGIQGAIVEISPKSNPESKRYTTTEYGGYFRINSVKIGDYNLIATFIGYADKEFTAKVVGMPKNVGTLIMVPATIKIEPVAVEAVAKRSTIEGDTLRFNADAFKVAADAEAEVLLKKMPGITMQDGNLEAQGEKVKQVYVDGLEFFGGNAKQVLQSIPAQAVESIEVYTRLSEAAQITGVDDGEGGKVINIVTRAGIKDSQFGKMHIGVGYEPDSNPKLSTACKYSGGGSLNIFRGDTRVTIMALVNNINKQNFTSDDFNIGSSASTATNRTMSINSQNGIARAEMFALNYTDKWGRRKRAKFEGTLFFNHLNAKNEFRINRWYNAPAKIDTMANNQWAAPNNYTFRFRGRLDWKIAKRQKLLLIPTLNYYNNSSTNSVALNHLIGIDGTDSITPNRWGESGYRYTPSGNEGTSSTTSGGLYGQYSYKFLRTGRIAMLVASINRTTSDIYRNYYSYSKSTIPLTEDDYSYSHRYTTTGTTTLRIQPSYREKIGRNTSLTLSYRFQTALRSRELLHYSTGQDYIISPEKLRKATSSNFEGSFATHQVGAGIRYSKNRNWFSISAYFQNSRLSNNNLWDKEVSKLLRTFNSPIYNATLQWAFSQSNAIRLSINNEVKSPSIWTMSNIYDVTNTSYISKGNPNLKPYTLHNFFARYTNTSTTKGTTFMIMAKAEYIQDFVGTKIAYSPKRFKVDGKNYSPLQITMPINLGGHWSYQARTSFGFPVSWLGSNINLTFGVNYTKIPIQIVDGSTLNLNDDPNFSTVGTLDMMKNLTINTGIVIGSNISENVDFTLDWQGSYSNNRSSIDIMASRYFTHRATGNIKVVLPASITLTAACAYTQYIGLNGGWNDHYTMLNIALGKKILSKKGEIQIAVNDILNQNSSFSRGVWAGYTQTRYNSIIGRYAMVKFIYNLRSVRSGVKHFRGFRGDAPKDYLAETATKLNNLKIDF